MIHVTLHVEESGHDFTITREEEFHFTGEKVTARLHDLVRSAEASMVGALTSHPEGTIES